MQKLYSVVENDCIERRNKHEEMYKHSRHNTRQLKTLNL